MLKMTTKDVFANLKDKLEPVALKNRKLTNVTGMLLTNRSIFS